MYYQVVIVPASSGFSEWQCLPINGDGYEDDYDLEYEIRHSDYDIRELGIDELPDGVEYIRGLIHNAPPRVFAVIDGDRIGYCGIAKKD
jgi:hypothetical protein